MNCDGRSASHCQFPVGLAVGLRMDEKLTETCGYEAAQACSKAITSLAFVCMAVTTS